MADTTEVVDQTQTQDTSTTTDTKTGTTDQQKTSQQTTQRPAADQNAGKWEAEKKGLLADLQKERKSRQTFETQVRDTNAALEQERRRVQALAGVNPKSAEDADEEIVRAKLLKMFPVLNKLTDEQVDKVLGVASKAEHLESAALAGDVRYGRQALKTVHDAVAKELGGTLTERQQQRVAREFVAWVSGDEALATRYENEDSTLIPEFVKQFAEDFFEPIKRLSTKNEADRLRRVPSSRDRSVVGTGGKKIDTKDPKAFEDALVNSFREHGGAFGE